MPQSTIFTGKPGIAIDGYILGKVLYVGCVMSGRLEDGTLLDGVGHKTHRILYQTKSTNTLNNYTPGSIGNYVVEEID